MSLLMHAYKSHHVCCWQWMRGNMYDRHMVKVGINIFQFSMHLLYSFIVFSKPKEPTGYIIFEQNTINITKFVQWGTGPGGWAWRWAEIHAWVYVCVHVGMYIGKRGTAIAVVEYSTVYLWTDICSKRKKVDLVIMSHVCNNDDDGSNVNSIAFPAWNSSC